jgi:hypothetical protein
MFGLAASSLHHNRSPLGAFLRRMKAKLGPAAGITATAHKIAILFFTLVTTQREYDDSISAQRDRQRNLRLEQKGQAASLETWIRIDAYSLHRLATSRCRMRRMEARKREKRPTILSEQRLWMNAKNNS